jgi:sec-independent protein translocase protein TatA
MGFGIWKLLLLLSVVFVVFGTGKLPNAMQDIAKGLKAFKDGLHGPDDEEKKEHPQIIVVNPQNDKKS